MVRKSHSNVFWSCGYPLWALFIIFGLDPGWQTTFWIFSSYKFPNWILPRFYLNSTEVSFSLFFLSGLQFELIIFQVKMEFVADLHFLKKWLNTFILCVLKCQQKFFSLEGNKFGNISTMIGVADKQVGKLWPEYKLNFWLSIFNNEF